MTRSASDSVLGGVASGLGRHLGIDPALVRVAFVVLALFGGSGLALYVILWIVLPAEDGAAALRSDSSTGRKVALAALLVVAIVSLPFAGPGFVVLGPALLVMAVVAAVGVLLWRAVGGEGDTSLVRAAWLVLAVAGALLLGAGAGVAAAFGGGTIVAVVVIAAGAALVVGGFLGGARWLVIPALVMAIPLSLVAATDIDLTGGVGERDYRPASVVDLDDSYRLGVGELGMDLSGVDFPTGTTALDLDVGVGHLQVLVPDDVCVQLRGHVGVGEVDAFDSVNDGFDVTVDHRGAPAGDAPVLALDARAGVGRIEVANAASGAAGAACPA
jgi:phage shock protein PspC (stress-responsive transcriptional regulator)/predicted membrane protein